ncbi:MAG: bacillithiol biosynthesis BshC [Saprospiraceae bacterium]|nr:bacillithiol biosynthesis BshC [Saprospiraceae bacterium]
MEKLHLTEEDVLLDDDKLITLYLEKNTGHNFHLNSEIEQTSKIFDAISETAKSIDPTLEMTVKVKVIKLPKFLKALKSRLKQVLKQKEETNIQQIRTIKAKLFLITACKKGQIHTYNFL